MTSQSKLTRRAALASMAALPVAGALSTTAQAAAPLFGPSAPVFNRVRLGGFDVTTLLVGSRTVDNPQSVFGMNVSAEEFSAAAAEANIPDDKVQFVFTPTVVNTGNEVVLFDTGLGGSATRTALEQAGYAAENVDVVVLTHMHGDHIGGLMEGKDPTFPNARYVTGAVEYDAWAKMDDQNFDTKMRPLAEQTEFLDPGGSVASGVTAVDAFGHTPGHMAYMLESNGQQLLIAGDLANHYVWSLARPDWEVRFDIDKAKAAESRKRILGMLAAEKMPLIGYHLPFPGLGYVETRGDGFHYVPHSYQLAL